jgi:hypothetical protein
LLNLCRVNLLDLDRREVVRERKLTGVGMTGATSSDAGSAVSVYSGGVICCVIQGMTLVRTYREGMKPQRTEVSPRAPHHAKQGEVKLPVSGEVVG